MASTLGARLLRLRVLLAFLSLAASACADEIPADAVRGVIEIDGSSTVYPITEATAEEFYLDQRGIEVTVGVSGTGGGFERFCAGETDINNASRPIRASEIEACRANGIDFIELPIAFDGLSIAANPENGFLDCITTEELKTIWEPAAEGRITRWNQVRPEWPGEALRLYGAGPDSGTFEYFTETINGEAGASRTDYTPSEDDNVLVQGVAGDRYSLGYFGLAYLEANQALLKGVAVDGGEGCVHPSVETVADGTYAPLSRPLLMYVKTSRAGAPEVDLFVDFYLANVNFLAADVGYVPLPPPLLAKVTARWESRVPGTLFDEAREGLGLEERLDFQH
jgi:phosphate transport system substrate-binding protein